MSVSREENQRPQGATGAGAFTPSYHREMLLDRPRVRSFQRAIEYYGGPDKTFLEIGPGTGVMVAHAARYYGRVFAVERDEQAHAITQQNLQRLGLLGTKVTLLHGDGLEMDLPRADVVMAELLSTLMVHEPQVPVMNRARTVLNPGGVLIPSQIINTVTLAWSKFGTQGVSFRSPYSLFTAVPRPEILSESRLLFRADFARGPVPTHVSETVDVTSLVDSEANSVVLASIVQLAPGITFSGSDSLNPPMVVPIEPVRLRAGDRVRVHVEYEHFSDWDRLRAAVEVAR